MNMPVGVTAESFFGEGGWFSGKFQTDPSAALGLIFDKVRPEEVYEEGELAEIVARVAAQHPEEFQEWLAGYVDNVQAARAIDPRGVEGSHEVPEVLRPYIGG